MGVTAHRAHPASEVLPLLTRTPVARVKVDPRPLLLGTTDGARLASGAL
ncbi:hypothetical protein GCM10009639_27430 [Kitasatospora putterlickiae]|uniref:Uncharacterized protein n=1 Tax=Kitasatospora putterlickiae TaxID=221725 RepID=A0ABN1XZM0_9ACTN